MAITVNEVTTSTNGVCNAPANISSGNLLIAGFFQNSGSGDPTLPSGWTLARRQVRNDGTASSCLAYKIATGSEPTSYTFSGYASSAIYDCYIVRCAGNTTSSVVDVVTSSDQATSGTTFQFLTVTTSTDGDLIYYYGSCQGTPTCTWPSGTTEVSDASDGESSGYEIQTSAGTTTARTITWASSTNDRWGIVVAFKPLTGDTSLIVSNCAHTNSADNVSLSGAQVSDDFNRADVNPLAGNWTTCPGVNGLKIVSNQVLPTTIGALNGAYWSANTFSNDQYSQATFVSGLNFDSGLSVRQSASASTYYFIGVSGTSWQFGKRIAGTWSYLGTAQTRTTANGTIVRLEVSGTTLKAYFNGVQDAYTFTDSSIASGYPGIGTYSTGLILDDWSGGDIGSAISDTGLVVSNCAHSHTSSSPQPTETRKYTFNYANRSALVADGWDFIGKTNTGATRDTENASYISYNVAGCVRVTLPTTTATIWNTNDNSRNTIFRDLPANWTSLRCKILNLNFTVAIQEFELIAYQDDGDYRDTGRQTDMSANQIVSSCRELNNVGETLATTSVTGTTCYLRLDRDVATDAIQSYYSLDGSTWTSVGIAGIKALTNPRLALYCGTHENTSYPSTTVDIEWAEVEYYGAYTGILEVQNASHNLASENIDLTLPGTLSVSNGIHGHTAENVVLIYSGSVLLIVSDSLLAHIADSFSMGGVTIAPSAVVPQDIIYTVDMTVYDSGIPGTTVLKYATDGIVVSGNYYEPRIKQPGNFKQIMFKEGSTGGESEVGYGEVVLINIDGGLDSLIDYGFSGRQIVIKAILSSGTYTLLTGTMEQPTATWEEISIRIKDRQTELDVPIQPTKYAGNNVLPAGLEGTADIKGKPKPLLFGKCRNITPVLVNTSKLIYQVNDGSILSLDAMVYDMGVELTKGPDYVSESDMLNNSPLRGVPSLPLEAGGTLIFASANGGNFLYCLALYSGSTRVLRLDMDNPNVWDVYGISNLPDGQGRGGVGVVVYDAKLWIFGGIDVNKNPQAYKTNLMLNLYYPTGSWSTTATTDMPATRSSHAVALSGTYAYVISGFADAAMTASVIRLNLSAPTGSWDDAGVTDLPAFRMNHKAVTYGGYIYVIGGNIYSGGYIATASVIRLNTAAPTGAWDDAGVTDLPIARQGHGTALGGSYLYVIGGYSDSSGATPLSTVIRLNLTSPTGSWTSCTDLPYPLNGNTTACEVYDNKLYVVSGIITTYLDLNSPTGDWTTITNYRVYPAGGCFRLGFMPAGQITADFTQGATTADRTVAQIIKQMALRKLTTGDLVTQDFTDLDATNNSIVGIYIDSETNIPSAIDEVGRTIGAWFGFGPDGKFMIKQLIAPTGTEDYIIEENDILSIARIPTNDTGRGVPAYRVVLDYDKNYTVQDKDLAGSVGVDARNWFAKEFRSIISEDTSILTKYLLAPELHIETLFTDSVNAQNEVNRLLALYKVRRDHLTVAVKFTGIVYSIGKIVKLAINRFGYNSTKLFRIIGFEVSCDTNIITLHLWG